MLEKGWIVLRGAGRRPRRVAEAAALPVTFGGLSRYNVANALAAVAACDALGLTPREIASGLTSFRLDEDANPGRLNLYERDGVLALVDFAHNEAGLTGLVEVARALAGSHAVRLAYGTAGDRTDEILHRLGVIAGCAVYMGAAQFAYWAHTQLIIDVVPGRGSGFSLEAPEGLRFLTRSRLFTDAETACLAPTTSGSQPAPP